jgi:hypothetical protein
MKATLQALKVMHRTSKILAAFVWIFLFPALTACGVTATPSTFGAVPLPSSALCDACAQATLAVELTQQKNNADNQAVASAEIVRANAQATLNSANATLVAVQTQDQSNADVAAAQLAATAQIISANAQATLSAAGATQSAALTQDAIHQTQVASLITASAEVLINQQAQSVLAAGTQTAVANGIATQTQSAAATSQWYDDQARQRSEQRQGSLTFILIVGLPIFILLLLGLILWAGWRWLKIQQDNQRILESPIARLQASIRDSHRLSASSSYLEGNIVPHDGQLEQTDDDEVHEWLDEVKNTLIINDKKDEDDAPDN